MYGSVHSDEAVVYLIAHSLNGTDEQKLAANFILECLRHFQTRDQFGKCLDDLETRALLDVAKSAKQMAAS